MEQLSCHIETTNLCGSNNKERGIKTLLKLIVVIVIALTIHPVAHLQAEQIQAAPPKRAVPSQTVQTHKVEEAVTVTPVQPATPAPQPVPDLNDHEQLMALAGISQSDWPAVDYIVTHESSWNPDATEPTTGAHGLPQALPYGKTGCGWDDAVCQLSWANSYAAARYGGWWEAQAYWASHGNW